MNVNVDSSFLSPEWLFRVKSGKVNGWRIVNKFGANQTVGPFVGPCDIGFMGRSSTGNSAIEVDFTILLERK